MEGNPKGLLRFRARRRRRVLKDLNFRDYRSPRARQLVDLARRVYACCDGYATVAVPDFLMVARDGIEPPTPAFSGPRSTTELPGLSFDKS